MEYSSVRCARHRFWMHAGPTAGQPLRQGMAEGVGFEPTVDGTAHGGFQDRIAPFDDGFMSVAMDTIGPRNPPDQRVWYPLRYPFIGSVVMVSAAEVPTG